MICFDIMGRAAAFNMLAWKKKNVLSMYFPWINSFVDVLSKDEFIFRWILLFEYDLFSNRVKKF